ncbi:MAG TPA: zinc ribbon domain-containing protein [Thermoplasmata archaeon]|nr:zinc ribbon domain-containing protein [Thermoplasmata archaeon]
MSRHLVRLPVPGGPARDSVRSIRSRLAVVAVLAVLLGSSLFAVPHVASAAVGAVAPTAPAAQPAVTHGDLVVGPGENYTILPTYGSPFYYQGGNITVEAGGTLFITNVTLVFVEFVGDSGTPIQRLAHIYSFADAGSVVMKNSTITTDLGVLNAYAKLLINVTGTFSALNSSMRFPGWIQDFGATADLTLNSTVVTANPLVPFVNEPAIIQGDTEFAPSISVLGGAALNLFNCTVNATYSDNTLLNGIPGPAPLTAADVPVDTPTYSVGELATPTDSANLTLDYLYYATGLDGGVAYFYYFDNGTGWTNATVAVTYESISYTLGTLTLQNDTIFGVATIAIPTALTDAINAGGLLAFLNNTGDFGLPSELSLQVTLLNGPAAAINLVSLDFYPTAQYDMVAGGAGTTVSAVDTALGLTYQSLPASPFSQLSPYPWLSNKFLFENGATGYLANVTTPSPIPGVFSTSAFLPDALSTIYLYRWADFNMSAENQPLDGVRAISFYAYNDNQLANATANALNDLKTANPAIWGYVNFWDRWHGISGYGVSNRTGQASVLLASSELGYVTLPSGQFLGGYNIGVIPAGTKTAQWHSFAVSPYPTGVAAGTPGYGKADRLNVIVILPPPAVSFVSFVVPTSPLDLQEQYASSGVIFINGPGDATLTVTATPVGGGSTLTVASGLVANGTFDLFWNSLSGLLTPGTTYNFVATAVYKTASATYDFPSPLSVPGSVAPTGFLYEKILGLPLWIWLAIAAAIVVGIVAALLIFRRQAAGKLVECGECGELIPEDATVCPKCGAEFENDLVRCSRCSSTIPASSQFCPECGAQLLGKPGEGEADPERQAYADFTERFRGEAKKELGDNYTESAFWDWWKRQPSYVPFSQWKAQQSQGTPRAGMSQPPAASQSIAPDTPPPRGSASPPPSAGRGTTSASAAPTATSAAAAAPPAAGGAAAASGGGGALRPCPNCGKEIPPEYLVCPFCGAVTQ